MMEEIPKEASLAGGLLGMIPVALRILAPGYFKALTAKRAESSAEAKELTAKIEQARLEALAIAKEEREADQQGADERIAELKKEREADQQGADERIAELKKERDEWKAHALQLLADPSAVKSGVR